MRAAMNAIKNNEVPYTPVAGTPALKEAISNKVWRENRIKAKSSEIIVTSGAKQAIFETLFVLTNPGDKIILFKPCWPALINICALLQLKPFFLDISQKGHKSISEFRRAKVIILVNPHNPTGKVFSISELKSLVLFARRNKMTIISDESYEKLIYEGKHSSITSIAPRSNIITVFSTSQTFSMMGWRLGYAIAPPKIIEAMEKVQGPITAGASAVSQAATEAALKTTSPQKILNEFLARRDYLFSTLIKIPWIRCSKPKGGAYLWCDISRLTKSSAFFANDLLTKKRVAVMPGESFGAPGYIRISFNSAPLSVLHKAVKAIEKIGNKLSSRWR